ncbi:glycosyltransferase family 2 protein [Mucilaginibacter terrae]|uniref:Glycosyltransferase involved in cell wall biosynthesis n=1 Tax=Mucilaginibacter terrae TaxID=1955052 RepID=A0ABU3GYC2_9SPHI|nr:glycosyltransferase family 2 protein [Mucilaginibacter terrae]MDT3404775.1 glycosyltransferase involved in cell wall biosynthesis [Mucilaginibacter terrae]
MSSYPLVSIITGYYNRKENLQQSIQSVLDQSYPNFEYIIFDDCSTDGTSELIAAFNDPRLRVLRHEKNMGFTKGIIAAIAESRGELIAIHGAGDVSFKERIAKQVQHMLDNPNVAIVGCLLEDVSKEGKVIHNPIADANAKAHFTQGEVMYRRSQYFQTGGYNAIFKYGQFTNLKRELLKLGEAGFVNELLYQRIHFDNGVTKNPKKRVEQRIYMHIGQELAIKESIFYVDVSSIAIKICLENLDMVIGTPQEDLLVFHLKKKGSYAYLLYKLYKQKALSANFFAKRVFKLLN